MKAKKYIMLLLAGMLVFGGCGNAANDAVEQDAQDDSLTSETSTEDEAEKENDQQSTSKEQTQDDQAVDNVSDDNAVKTIDVLIDEYYEDKPHESIEYFSVASVKYPMIRLTDEYERKYEKLGQTLATDNLSQQEASRKSLEDLKESYDEYEQYLDPGEDVNYSYYFTDEVKASILRADTRVLAVGWNYYGFSGGAHGYYAYGGTSYDTQTGKKLAITDVIKDTDKLLELIAQKLPEQYPNVQFVDLDEYIKDFNLKEENAVAWSLDYSGITFYFNPYELASYADGAQVITITFDEAPEIFNEYYTEVPTDYIASVTDYKSVYLDVDEDGKMDKIGIEGQLNDEGSYTWHVKAGNRTYSTDENAYSYRQESFVVKSEKGNYFYLIEFRENDYATLDVINLKTMISTKEDEIYLNVEPYGTWDEEKSTYYVLTNPNRMLLGSRINCMSTYTGLKTYHVSDNGLPVSDDELYTSEFTYVLVTKNPITCKEVDKAGKVINENAEIKKGTYLRIVRTNGDNLVDMQVVDSKDVNVDKQEYDTWYTLKNKAIDWDGATIYRMETTLKDDWEVQLNGQPAYDQFEGIMFAG